MAESEFATDRRRVSEALESSRAELLAVLGGLTIEDLDRGRRGGWSVRIILQHVIDSEAHYGHSIAALRGRGRQDVGRRGDLQSLQDAAQRLLASRRALLAGVEGVDEDSFYRLQRMPTEEGFGQDYSILSVLENVVSHEREHAGQIMAIIRGRVEP